MNIFELEAKIGINTSEFDQGVEEAKSRFSGLKDVFAGSFLSDMAQKAMSFGVDFAKESVEMASNLAEVQNVIDVTFGDGADQINVWAKNLKGSFGIGELSAKRFSGTIGAMLKSMGMTDEETMEMSTSLVELTADMASFYNLDHEEAFQKIRAGISGETEPLKQLGINMSVANLEAYAMSQGITKAYNAMTQAEQATLRYNYLLSATAGAQGDFARTSDSYSNSVKTFQENVNTIMAQAGQVVIDIINPVLQTINEALADLTKETVEEQIAGVEKSEQEEIQEANLKKYRADTLIDTLEELSKKTELSEYETKLWESALQELVATFPELASHIDLANKSILTSTDEIRANTEAAWQNAREKAKIRALEQKEQIKAAALEKYASDTIAYELAVAELNAQEKIKKAFDTVYSVYGHRAQYGTYEDTLPTNVSQQEYLDAQKFLLEQYGMDTENFDANEFNRKSREINSAYDNAAAAVADLSKEMAISENEFEIANEEYKKTEELMSEIVEKHEEEAAATQAATEAQNAYNTALENEVTAFETVEKAWESVKQHRDETYNQMRESLKNGTNDLWGVVADLTEIDINKSMETARDNMSKNMAFYAEYATNLRNAQRAGVDEGLLAELAREQTAENYALLEYLYTQENPQEINQLNESWKHLQTAKDSLATTMTDATLAVDEGYAGMVDAAKKAVEELNQYETARQNAIDTGAGVTDGLSAAIPEIEAKVQQINAIIQSVGATPITLDFGITGIPSASAGLADVFENACASGVRRGLSGQKIGIDARGLSGALAPSISAAIARQTVEGRYG